MLIKNLQAEITCYSDYATKLSPGKASHYELHFVVYTDRVTFVGSPYWLKEFFRRHNILADSDREGLSISIPDSETMGLDDLETGYYKVSGDRRKKPVQVT